MKIQKQKFIHSNKLFFWLNPKKKIMAFFDSLLIIYVFLCQTWSVPMLSASLLTSQYHPQADPPFHSRPWYFAPSSSSSNRQSKTETETNSEGKTQGKGKNWTF
jgi:hypothetical protein